MHLIRTVSTHHIRWLPGNNFMIPKQKSRRPISIFSQPNGQNSIFRFMSDIKVYLAGGSAPRTPLWRLRRASYWCKGVLDPARSCTAARPRHGTPGKLSLTNVAAARPRHGARKNCCSPSRFGVGVGVGGVRYQIQILRFARDSILVCLFAALGIEHRTEIMRNQSR